MTKVNVVINNPKGSITYANEIPAGTIFTAEIPCHPDCTVFIKGNYNDIVIALASGCGNTWNTPYTPFKNYRALTQVTMTGE